MRITKQKLSSSSAAVLIFSRDFYSQFEVTKQFLDSLDLSEGQLFCDELLEIWPHYGFILEYRKQALHSILKNLLENKEDQQVVTLASGWDPLSLLFSSQFQKTSFFDIDQSPLELKQKYFQSLGLENVHFLKADLTKHETVLKALTKKGFDTKRPTIFIAEGISYYVTHQDLSRLIKNLKKDHVHQHLILEYFCQKHEVNSFWAEVIENITTLFLEKFSLPSVSLYGQDDLEKLCFHFKAQLLETQTLHHIEKAQQNKNTHFQSHKEGHVRISLLGS